MPVKPAVKKKCNRQIRKAGEHVTCGISYTGDVCPNKEQHLLKFKTGYCNNGWCEGSKAKDWRGDPVPTCKFTVTCPCGCHDVLDELFALTGAQRLVVESSGYVRPERSYWMPSDDPTMGLSSADGDTVAPYLESPMPDAVPGTLAVPFKPTPTGRAARGELEAWVKEACDIWLVDQPGVRCTPTYLAEEIARSKGITPPSVGAIGAVFDRWTALGFAVCTKKPVQFVKYTEDGIKLGLERMKADAKAAKKRQQRQLERGYR